MSCGRSARPGADLGRLLAQQTRPDAQLTLPLQGGGLGVEPADRHEVAVEPAVLVVGEVDGVLRTVGGGDLVDALAVGGEQLDESACRCVGACSVAGRCLAVALRHPCLPVRLSRPRRGLPVHTAAAPPAGRREPVGRAWPGWGCRAAVGVVLDPAGERRLPPRLPLVARRRRRRCRRLHTRRAGDRDHRSARSQSGNYVAERSLTVFVPLSTFRTVDSRHKRPFLAAADRGFRRSPQ